VTFVVETFSQERASRSAQRRGERGEKNFAKNAQFFGFALQRIRFLLPIWELDAFALAPEGFRLRWRFLRAMVSIKAKGPRKN
jgi:hypothetical protein